MVHKIVPAILSGGAGTRLWPVSTDARPKQFHSFGAGEHSLLQDTIARVRGKVGDWSFTDPIILGSQAHAELIEAQLAAIGVTPRAIVLEPMGRNTAATAVIAAALAQELEPGALVLLLPADHVIADVAAFRALIERTAPIAHNRLVTFGISPDRPATGYGYIRQGRAILDGVFVIDAFKEKPDEATAQTYLDQGGYAWNAGMFFFSPETLLAEFSAAPDIRDAAMAALAKAERNGVRVALPRDLFGAVPSAPLDIAVMEKTTLGAVAPGEMGWADLGAWDEIWRLASQDASGVVAHGDIIAIDARNCLLRSDGVRIAAIGVDDLLVIASGDTVVVAPRSRAQDVKKLLEEAKKRAT